MESGASGARSGTGVALISSTTTTKMSRRITPKTTPTGTETAMTIIKRPWTLSVPNCCWYPNLEESSTWMLSVYLVYWEEYLSTCSEGLFIQVRYGMDTFLCSCVNPGGHSFSIRL